MEINNKRIYVTQEDIHNGICNNPHSCAVALALENEIEDSKFVEIGWYYDHMNMNSENIDIRLIGDNDEAYDVYINKDHKSKLGDFIKDFDRGKRVKPMSFIIDKVERSKNESVS